MSICGKAVHGVIEGRIRTDSIDYDLCALALYEFALSQLDEPIEDCYIDFSNKVVRWFETYWIVSDDYSTFYPSKRFRRKDDFNFARSSADFQKLLLEHDALVGYAAGNAGDAR